MNAVVDISTTSQPDDQTLEELRTDESGNTEEVELSTPPLEYSMEPGANQPFSEYYIKINAPGYEEKVISGSDLFAGQNQFTAS